VPKFHGNFLGFLPSLVIPFCTRFKVGERRDIHVLTIYLMFQFVLFSVPHFLRSPSASESFDEEEGTIWGVLVAGSKGWWNYRHQVIKRNCGNYWTKLFLFFKG
jgi:hypothetical protein